MQKKPTINQIQEYLKKYNPLGLSGASIELINEHNHLIYKLENQNRICCLRMINPESPRADEWLTMAEEHTLLNLIDKTWLGPKSYLVDMERFVLPLTIQEFVSDIVCFNDLKPLFQEHLQETAKAIAVLNSQEINPDNFAFRFTRYSYSTSVKTWRKRLCDIKYPPAANINNVFAWIKNVTNVINRAEKILIRFEPWLQKASPHFCLNFDGAHCGNSFWHQARKHNKVVFLDWQKVSFGDPSFTLARFLTSLNANGKFSEPNKNTMLEAYLAKKRDVPSFGTLLDQRLFERQVADFIWVIWNHVRENKTGPLNADQRYENVLELLREYQ